MDSDQLPDDLRNRALGVMKEVGAYIGSNGDPEVMNSFKEPPSIFVLALITGFLVIIAFVISELANFYEIKQNWSHYRCMPSVAPFAQFYGHDLTENMNYCISQNVKEHAPGVIDPIYQGISVVAGVVDGVYNKVEAIESGISGLLKGFESFIVNFVNSFRLIGVRVRMTFVRIKDIFSRVYGIFIAFAYAAISAITFGENLICNPLVVFLGVISGVDICCFAPETQIRMESGDTIPIKDVKIGDKLMGGAEVTTTYLFAGANTKMVRVHGVHMSANHYILNGRTGRMGQAGDHPSAIQAEALPRLWCLATTDNRLPIVTPSGDLMICADYEESSDPDVISEAQRIAEMSLNNGLAGPTVPDYSLGLDPTFTTLLRNGSWKQLDALRVGDILANGVAVTGVIREVCDTQVETPDGFAMSAAQLVYYETAWRRATHVGWRSLDRSTTLCHIMVSHNQPFLVRGAEEVYCVRDYAEVESLDIQRPYDTNLTSGTSI
jgi:hypothetical protein